MMMYDNPLNDYTEKSCIAFCSNPMQYMCVSLLYIIISLCLFVMS